MILSLNGSDTLTYVRVSEPFSGALCVLHCVVSHVSGPEVNYDVIMGYINSAIRR